MSLALSFEGARVLRPGGWSDAPLSIAGGRITDGAAGRAVDLSGYDVLPGIVDAHGDGFERHLAPRRGALADLESGVVSLAAELAANGITTATLAQFWSWEGGMRGPDFALRVFDAVTATAGDVAVDLRLQMRLETHFLEGYPGAEEAIARYRIPQVVFSDHLPHDRLSDGRRPARLTGQALKSGRNPEAHLALMTRLHDGRDAVPQALDRLIPRLLERGVRLGSHDDRDARDRIAWRARGVPLAEFPETKEAAREARSAGEPVVLGAPNVVRGASHAGKVSARDLVADGLCDALASDYHYPAPARAAMILAESGLLPLQAAWALVSRGPAGVLGLTDRGTLEPGQRADLVILERTRRRIAATIAGGEMAFLSGPLAHRFLTS